MHTEFASKGVHCDVGGGYVEAESGLSKITIKWMVEQARQHGLRFDLGAEAAILPALTTQNSVAADFAALQHESLSGLWWLAEFLPKRIKDPAAGFKPRWIIHCGRHRYVAAGSKVHVSLLERRNQLPNYSPPNMPVQFEQVS